MFDIRNPLKCDEALQYLKEHYPHDFDRIAKAYSIIKDEPRYSKPGMSEGSQSEKTAAESELTFLEQRLNTACVLAENCGADPEIVMASLLGPGVKAKVFFRNTLEVRIETATYERMMGCLRPIPNTCPSLEDAAVKVDALLWDITADRQKDKLIAVYKETIVQSTQQEESNIAFTVQTAMIENAYKIAKEAHRGALRHSGEAYIFHPLAVAQLLAERGADMEILAAALLHDVVEDAGISVSALTELSEQTARYVDAVTSVDLEYKEYLRRKEELGEDFEEKDKEDLDRESAEKLLRIAAEDSSMVPAVYIKAADRLHNLRTIRTMPYDKIRRKLEETEDYYLPIFRAFGIRAFIPAIEEELELARNSETYRNEALYWEAYLQINRNSRQNAKRMLEDLIQQDLERKCKELYVQRFSARLIEEPFYPSQIDKANQSEKDRSPQLQVFSVLKPGPPEEHQTFPLFANVFIKALEDKNEDGEHAITRIWSEPLFSAMDDHYRIGVELENWAGWKTHILLYDTFDYYRYMNGSSDGVVFTDQDPDLKGDIIHVLLKDGKIIELPKGATVLDAAFAIHAKIGTHALAASINGSEMMEKLLYNVLAENDQIVIDHCADKGENDPIKDLETATARIDWLNHVVTSKARKRITRCLQKKYEEKAST